MINDEVSQARHCHNNHCTNRDICLWASEWRPEQPVFFGDEKDCQDFVSNERASTQTHDDRN